MAMQDDLDKAWRDREAEGFSNWRSPERLWAQEPRPVAREVLEEVWESRGFVDDTLDCGCCSCCGCDH